VSLQPAWFRRLSLSSIRSRMLVIALLPALLAEFGMVAYFTSQALATAENALHARALSAVRHLADTLPYALVSGDTALAQHLLEAETRNSQLTFARVTDPHGHTLASAGDTLRGGLLDDDHRQRATIHLPTAVLRDGPLFATRAASASDLLGQVEVGVRLDQVGTTSRYAPSCRPAAKSARSPPG